MAQPYRHKTVSLYNVVGRKAPTEDQPEPPIIRMKIFANNEVTAKSRFWYFLHKMSGKMKRTTGQILDINQITEKNPNVINNYGIWIRYDSRSNTHNMFKEYRDLTLCGAVDQMYNELAGLHRARPRNIQILKTATLADKTLEGADGEVSKPSTFCENITDKAGVTSEVVFPLPHRIPRDPLKKFRSTFRASRPSTFKQ